MKLLDFLTRGGECPKCGCYDLVYKYDPQMDRVRKRCKRCDYFWSEVPKDRKEPK